MKQIMLIILTSIGLQSIMSQEIFSYLPVKEKVKQIYPKILKYPNQDEYAFMSTDLNTAFHTIRLNKLTDKVADELKKAKTGEWTKPIYVGETCYIVKINKRKAFGYYDLVIVFFAPRNRDNPKGFTIKKLKDYHKKINKR